MHALRQHQHTLAGAARAAVQREKGGREREGGGMLPCVCFSFFLFSLPSALSLRVVRPLLLSRLALPSNSSCLGSHSHHTATLRYDPDVITFQECDHFYDFFLPVMQVRTHMYTPVHVYMREKQRPPSSVFLDQSS